jgi:hypothetical protein
VKHSFQSRVEVGTALPGGVKRRSREVGRVWEGRFFGSVR